MKIGIYKITSPSGKTYIGQSTNIYTTWLYRYKNIEGCKRQPKIYNSLKKYGYETHKFEIIEECTLEQLNERETYYKQLELDKVQENWQKVLFCELYDRGGGPKSEETKQKLRGQKRSPEFGINQSLKTLGKKKHTKESKLKLSLAHKGRKRTEETKQKMRKPKILRKKEDLRNKYKKRISPNKGNKYSVEVCNNMSLKALKREPTRLDKNIYTFIDKSNNKFTGTQFEFYTKFNLRTADVNTLVRERNKYHGKKSVKGWKVQEYVVV